MKREAVPDGKWRIGRCISRNSASEAKSPDGYVPTLRCTYINHMRLSPFMRKIYIKCNLRHRQLNPSRNHEASLAETAHVFISIIRSSSTPYTCADGLVQSTPYNPQRTFAQVQSQKDESTQMSNRLCLPDLNFDSEWDEQLRFRLSSHRQPCSARSTLITFIFMLKSPAHPFYGFNPVPMRRI